MKIFAYISFVAAVIAIVLGIIARLFMPNKILLGLAAITYLRLTITLLLFAIGFHLIFKPAHS